MDTLLRGFLIGFSIAAPVGPIGVLCIQRTLAQGRRYGFVSGLGAATADAAYGSIAGFGLAFLSGFLVQQQAWLRLGGGLFLLYLGVRTFLRRPAGREAHAQDQGLLRAFLSTLFLTLTNPMTILSFAAIFAGLGVGSRTRDYQGAGVLVLGVFLGSAGWWLILSGLASLLRGRMNAQALTWVNRVSGVVIAAFGAAALLGAFQPSEKMTARIEAGGLASPALAASQGYARAEGVRTFTFPDDFGAHPDFQTEWWYYTGNLKDPQGRRFGYQLTFFRRALLPPQEGSNRTSTWATDQAYLAHFAITDVRSGEHVAFERLSRGAAGLAGVESSPFQVWLEDWRVEETAPSTYRLFANVSANSSAEALNGAKGKQSQTFTLDLVLKDLTGPILQGDQGYSQKGSDPGSASYYFSQPRLASQGMLQIDGQTFQVEGMSWMDHEFSTSALSPGQVGWDWFSIQLDDGSELMVFQIRRQDGTIDPFSSGTWIAPDGSARHLGRNDFEITATDTWKSPQTGAVYPARWTVRVPSLSLELDIRPVVAEQELDLSYQYWEGAVDVVGAQSGSPVSGVGYVELTGYAGSMAGEF